MIFLYNIDPSAGITILELTTLPDHSFWNIKIGCHYICWYAAFPKSLSVKRMLGGKNSAASREPVRNLFRVYGEMKIGQLAIFVLLFVRMRELRVHAAVTWIGATVLQLLEHDHLMYNSKTTMHVLCVCMCMYTHICICAYVSVYFVCVFPCVSAVTCGYILCVWPTPCCIGSSSSWGHLLWNTTQNWLQNNPVWFSVKVLLNSSLRWQLIFQMMCSVVLNI